MKKQTKQIKMRKAFGTVDAMMGIGILLFIVLIGYFVKSKVGVPNDIRTATMKVETVLQGIENAKTEYNNGVFVASSKKAVPNITKLKLALGGAKGSASLGSWTYECSAGTSSTIKINTNTIPDADIRSGIVESINSKYSYWVATDKGSTVEITRANSNCN